MFEQEINRKHLFMKLVIVLCDDLLEKILEWTKEEPIYVDCLELEIQGKKIFLNSVKL